ncbi:MAG: hypothetical protein ACE5J4_00505 [Candidatus Aenigmatarchaeota archaeon]
MKDKIIKLLIKTLKECNSICEDCNYKKGSILSYECELGIRTVEKVKSEKEITHNTITNFNYGTYYVNSLYDASKEINPIGVQANIRNLIRLAKSL